MKLYRAEMRVVFYLVAADEQDAMRDARWYAEEEAVHADVDVLACRGRWHIDQEWRHLRPHGTVDDMTCEEWVGKETETE